MSGTLKNNLFGGEDFGVLHKDINKALESVMTSSGEVSSFCLLYTSPSPRDRSLSRMPSSA